MHQMRGPLNCSTGEVLPCLAVAFCKLSGLDALPCYLPLFRCSYATYGTVVC